MWLIIREADDKVVGTNYNVEPSPPAGHVVKRWHGPEPPLGSTDPTLDNPDWDDFIQSRDDFDMLDSKAANEIAYLEATIPDILTMTLEELRVVVKRLAQENLEEIKAWRYLFKKFL